MNETQSTPTHLYINVDPDLRDLFPNYLFKRQNELKIIDSLVAEGKLKEIEFIGHKIAGNAGLFSLDEFSQLGHLLEQAARACDSAQILEISTKMTEYLNRVQPAPDSISN